jgi:vacuolar-type H+-ATPase subunit E/Vma4
MSSAYSNELNISRLRTLKAREEGVQRVLGEAHKRLSVLTKDANQYKQLLKKLIIQVWRDHFAGLM